MAQKATSLTFPDKPRNLKIGAELNRGAWGTVYSGELEGRPVAVKQIHELLHQGGGEEERRKLFADFREECKKLQSLSHPHVVGFIGAFNDRRLGPILVMEKMQENLRQFLNKCKKNVRIPKQLRISLEIIRGVAFLHQQTPPLVHRDLNDKNVMFSTEGVIKIGDFGQSKLKKDLYLTSGQPGMVTFMPPEALDVDTSKYNESLDIFSVGVLMLEIGTQQEPLVNLRGIGVIREVDRRERDLKALGEEHPLRQPVLLCLKDNPKERPKASDLQRDVLALVDGIVEATAIDLRSQITTLQAALEGEIAARNEHEVKLASQFQSEVASRDANIRQLEEKCELLEAQVMEGSVPLTADVAEGTADEDLLQQLCYMATGVKQLLISPDGGTFKLGSGDASLVFPPGAVEKELFIRYAIILHGPFVLPPGYKPGSVGVYLNMDGSTLVKPVQLFLCHWCIKQEGDDATPKFIRAPHTLEEGVKEYTFEELGEEADFTSYTNVGVLTIREPCCLYCVETNVETKAQYSAITLTRNVPSDETLFFRIQLMCDSREWSTKLTGLLEQRGWQHGYSDIVTRFSYSSDEKPIEASTTKSEGLGWEATIEGQHQIKETAFLMPKRKSKSDMEQEVNSGRFPPCLCYKIQYTSPEERRVRRALLKVDLLGADVDLTFSCTFKEEPKLSVPSPVSTGPSLSAEIPPSSSQPTIHRTADVIDVLDGKLDAKWRRFGTFLHVEPAIMDKIEKDKSDVEDCMLKLVEDWLCKKDGTGELPRTWKTVVQAVTKMKVPLPEQLKEQCGQ